MYVEFTDAANRHWYRDLTSNKYVSKRRVQRLKKRLPIDEVKFRIRLARVRRKARAIKNTLPEKHFW
jgi:hypothetical protein